MAVFVAASDETSGGNAMSVYHYAGWITTARDWIDFFTPAWQQRVLDGPPPIPYLHMTDMRSPSWRALHHLSDYEADERLDEAARVIHQLGSLRIIDINVDAAIFKPLFKEHKMRLRSGGSTQFSTDFFAFIGYAYGVLNVVHLAYPDAEKVSFMVENNSIVTKHIGELYDSLPASLTSIGRPELAALVGEFLPVSKDQAPVQAADYLCWHTRRAKEGTLDERSARRFNTISVHKGFSIPLSERTMAGLANEFSKCGEKSETRDRVRRIRQNHARSNERTARRNKGSSGRGESRKHTEAEG